MPIRDTPSLWAALDIHRVVVAGGTFPRHQNPRCGSPDLCVRPLGLNRPSNLSRGPWIIAVRHLHRLRDQPLIWLASRFAPPANPVDAVVHLALLPPGNAGRPSDSLA